MVSVDVKHHVYLLTLHSKVGRGGDSHLLVAVISFLHAFDDLSQLQGRTGVNWSQCSLSLSVSIHFVLDGRP